MKGKILIIDDEGVARKSLSDILRLEGYLVTAAEDGEGGLQAAKEETFDLILLDIKMPGIDGIEVLRELIRADSQVKVIMLTGHGSMESAIEALRIGAHDYLLKPAKPEEIIESVSRGLSEKAESKRKRQLLGQIEASIHELKESEGVEQDTPAIRSTITIAGNVSVDLERREVWQDDLKVFLTPTEGKLLRVLLENRGRVLSHKDLVFLVQGYQTTDWEAPEIMRPLVSRLRRKLSKFSGGVDWIVNVRGTGYVLDGD